MTEMTETQQSRQAPLFPDEKQQIELPPGWAGPT